MMWCPEALAAFLVRVPGVAPSPQGTAACFHQLHRDCLRSQFSLQRPGLKAPVFPKPGMKSPLPSGKACLTIVVTSDTVVLTLLLSHFDSPSKWAESLAGSLREYQCANALVCASKALMSSAPEHICLKGSTRFNEASPQGDES